MLAKAISYQAQQGSRPIIVRLSSEQGYMFIECFIQWVGSQKNTGCHMIPPSASVAFLWLLVAVAALVRSLPLILIMYHCYNYTVC